VNRRAERAAVVSFAIAIVGGIVAAVGYATDHTERMLGLGLAAALFATGFGLVAWAKSLGIDEHVAEERTVPSDANEELDALHDHLATSSEPLGRRRALQALFAGSLGAIVIGFVGPLGSLGPRPRGERGRTSWAPGRRLVTAEGQPIDAATARFDQLVTVFPEGAVGVDDSQVVLLRVRPESLTERTQAAGAVLGWVAYSKICTHAGCSVGLFAIDTRPPIEVRELVCPCHQSVFDPLDGARPIGGPAPRPLPQLPLAIDDNGFLVAVRDFERPIGPIAWDEG
jgi:ubiquinol-cytochrome c reductase iron-sulfur subunit